MATKATRKTAVDDDDAVEMTDVEELAQTATPARPKREPKPEPKPGDADFDWAAIYVEGTVLKRYEDPSGTVVCLPPIPTPDAGDMFADLLTDVSDQAILFKLIRQAVLDHAVVYEDGLAAISSAFRGGGKLTDIESLLRFWSGSKLPK